MIRNTHIQLAIGVVAVIAALATVTGAFAHAHYMSSTPAKGAVLQTAPTSVEITFAEEIQTTAGSYGLTVEKDGGSSVTSGNPTPDGDKMSIALQSGIGAGRYVVNWHNVSSDDGDAAEGAFSFYVQTQPTADDLAKDAELENVGAEEETPTAEAASPTAVPATPAPATSPEPPLISPAPGGGGALPSTGTGPAGSRGASGVLWLVIAGTAATAGIGTTLLARTLRRR